MTLEELAGELATVKTQVADLQQQVARWQGAFQELSESVDEVKRDARFSIQRATQLATQLEQATSRAEDLAERALTAGRP
jgi:uncharacterized protein YoxC